MKGQTLFRTIVRAMALVSAAAGLGIAAPAAAQFSDGYKFLEAVKKRDGDAATKALTEPGTTIVNSRDITTGTSALHIVVERRDTVWLNFLLQNRANPNLRDNRGVTPIELATSLRYIEAIEVLADAGANLDETNSTGETPLILAVHLGDTDLVKALLAKGADPDRADNSGRNARDYAQMAGRSSTLVSLMDSIGGKNGARGTYGPAPR